MKLFVKCHRNGADAYYIYEGFDQATVTRLLTELGTTSVEYITQEDWEAAALPQP